MTPGSGPDPGETPEIAATRGLWEEIGYHVDPAALGPAVALTRASGCAMTEP